jgi:hypothetical protein
MDLQAAFCGRIPYEFGKESGTLSGRHAGEQKAGWDARRVENG